MTDMVLIGSANWRDRIHQNFNRFVFYAQSRVGRFYAAYFNMYAALSFSLLAGACFGFSGDDCYGKIPFASPVFWCLSLLIICFLFQTFILVTLTFWRIVRLATVGICGHYLASQAYGFWSLRNFDLLIGNLANTPAKIISSISILENQDVIINGTNKVVEGASICKPYAYANITYGQLWIILPAVILIGLCFVLGDKRAVLEEV